MKGQMHTTCRLRARRIGSLAAMFVLAAGVSGCQQALGAEGDDTTDDGAGSEVVLTATVRTASVGVASAGEQRTLIGRGAMPSDAVATLTAPYGGRVAQVHVAGDTLVAAGAPLVEMAPRPDALAELDVARAEEAAAAAQWETAQVMFEHQLTTVDVLEAARGAASTARAARSAVQRTRASSASTVSSESAGVVTEVLVSAGAWVDAGDPLVRIADVSRVEAVFGIEPDDAPRVMTAAVSVRSVDAAIPPTPGRVSSVGWAVSPTTHTIDLHVALPATTEVREGQPLLADLTFDVAPHTVVPWAALVSGQEGDVVFVVDGDVARQVPVRVLFDRGDDVAVEAPDLADGMQVVIEGNYALEDGMQLRVAP